MHACMHVRMICMDTKFIYFQCLAISLIIAFFSPTGSTYVILEVLPSIIYIKQWEDLIAAVFELSYLRTYIYMHAYILIAVIYV